MATTKVKIGLVAAAMVALATPFAMQHRAQVKLREENSALRQQNEEVAGLTAENTRLSNLLVQTQARPVIPDDRSSELLKLRSEVSRLREESRELARLKAGETDAGYDPSIHETLRTLAARATQLKRHAEQMPERRIPELGLITDKEWIDAVAKNQLTTDEEYRQAMNSLRSSGKQKLGNMMQKALKKYAAENNGMLPSDLSQLQPYFEKPVDAATLQRYQLMQTGKLDDISNEFLIAEIAPPVDEDYDSNYKFSLNGTSSRGVNRTSTALEAATRAYAKANNGFLPRDPSQLAAYLDQPLDPARVQKHFDQWPANVTTIDQLNALRR